jgi:tetratricopeptide (TPR) repeat protein
LLQNKTDAAVQAFESELSRTANDLDGMQGLGLIEDIHDGGSKAVDPLFELIMFAPSDPRALSDFATVTGDAELYGLNRSMIPMWTKLSTDAQAPPVLRYSAQLYIAECRSQLGDLDDAKETWNKLDYIRSWRVIGAFDNVSKSGFKKAFAPETAGVDLSAKFVGKNDLQFGWRPLELVKMNGNCDIAGELGDNGASVYYAATAVQAHASGPALAWFDPTGASKIWINGHLVLSDDIYRNYSVENGEEFSFPVQLNAGWNTILVKCADDSDTRGSFSLRFTSADTTEPLDVSADPSRAAHGPVETSTGAGAAAVPAMVAIAKAAPVNLQNLIALAQLEQSFTDFGSAEAAIQQAIALAPNCGLLHSYYADILGDDSQEDNARSERDIARADLPDDIRDQSDYVDDDTEKAPMNDRLALMRDLHKKFPLSAIVMMELADLLKQDNLSDQGFQYLHAAYRIAKSPTTADRICEACSDAGRIQDEQEILDDCLKLYPGSITLLGDDSSLLQGLGKTDAAIAADEKEIAFGADPVSVLSDMESDFESAHNVPRALAVLEQEIAYRPQDAEMEARIADVYADSNAKSKAIAAYNAAIALDPSRLDLRDKVRLIAGYKPVVDLVPAIDGAPLIAAARSAKPDGSTQQASVRFLLDEGREVVYPDGATDVRYHQIAKIQDQTGVDIYSEKTLALSSATAKIKVFTARLIKPDGKTIASNTSDEDDGGNSGVVDFPSLEVGDIVDLDYEVTDYQSGALSHNFWSDWYFRFPNESVDLSQYSLITPSGMDMTIADHGDVPAVSRRDDQGWTIRTWKASAMPIKTLEPLSPTGNDAADWVDFSTVDSWSKIASWYVDIASSACTPDDTIRAQAATLTAGMKTDAEKIKAVVEYVRGLRYESTPFRLSAYVPTDGKEVILERYGDCKDKAALICSLLGSLGIDAEMVLLSPRTKGITPMLPSPRFDHAIARIKIGDSWQWVDATADQMEYGDLPYVDQGVPTLIIDSATTQLTPSPAADPSRRSEDDTMTTTLSADGSLKGKCEVTFQSNRAWLVRTALRQIPADRRNEVLQGFATALIPNSISDSGSIGGLDDPDAPVTVDFNYHVDSYAGTSGDLLLLKVPWDADPASGGEFDLPATRTQAIDSAAIVGTTTATVQIAIPAGFKPDSLPKPLHLTSAWGSCDISYSQSAGTVTVTRSLTISAQRIEAADAASFITFLKSIRTESSKELVLKGSGG